MTEPSPTHSADHPQLLSEAAEQLEEAARRCRQAAQPEAGPDRAREVLIAQALVRRAEAALAEWADREARGEVGPPADTPTIRLQQTRILYQDEHLVAVSKPAGVFVHRSQLGPDRAVLLQHVRDLVGAYVYPLHRLDRPTSGVVLFALSEEAARTFKQALEQGEKTYLAMARGITPEHQLIDRPLTKKSGRGGPPQEARTEFWRLGVVAERNSLLKVRIYTGRRHQIRRHLSGIAHQLIGDSSYGKGRINRYFQVQYGLPRIALHAWSVRLQHPFTGKPLFVHAPLPPDLLGFLQRLPDWHPDLLREMPIGS